MGTAMISLRVIQLDFCFLKDKGTWIEFIEEEGVLAVKNRSKIANCVEKSKSEEIKLSTNVHTQIQVHFISASCLYSFRQRRD